VFGFWGFFDLASETNTELDCLGVNVGGPKRGRMDKQIGTSGIVLDECEAVIDIPDVQRAVPTGLLFLFQAEFEAAALNNIAAAKPSNNARPRNC
jgi:hypothetical protein